jgi:SAM-dependent methyltransferase
MEVNKNSWAYWYDLINQKKRNDSGFYQDLISDDSLALELGCGTGRLYLDMIDKGYEVHGLDLSENMLIKLKKKAERRSINSIKLFNQDISQMEIENKYDLIYYPFNSITHIRETQNKINTFKNIKSHLKDDGKFAFDLYVLDFEVVKDYNNIEYKEFEHNNTAYRFETWGEIEDQVKQTIRSKNRIINLDNDHIEWDEYHKLSLYPKQQIELLFEVSGFSDYKFYDGFTNDELHKNSDIMSVVAQK